MSATFTCQNGHESGDAEWCDTCGAPIGGSPSVPSASVPPAAAGAPVARASAATPVACPHCEALNPADALFCESCGYDFTTGQAPPAPAAPPPAPAEPAAPPAVLDPTFAPQWLVVVEVDPDWHRLKGELADQPLPPMSTSTVQLATHAALVGRSSQSKGIHPEVALDRDTGVSRRHAQLITEGETLSVIDLASTNGTYVVTGADTPTDDLDPIEASVPVALHDGDRIYVGAWTRLTVRKV